MLFSMGNLVDSSVLVALFLDFDTQHTKAERVWRQLQGHIYIPYCVANEVITILTYKHSKQQADKFIDFLAGVDEIEVIEDTFQREAEFYKKLNARVSFTDAALILFSLRLQAGLITFDKQLERLAKKS